MDSDSDLLQGIVIGGLMMWVLTRHRKRGVYCLNWKSDDDCQSLFYGHSIGAGGVGFPEERKGYSDQEIVNLKNIRPQYVRLPASLYRDVVWNMPTVCVDVLLYNPRDNKLLLFLRKDKPAADIW